MKGTLKVEVSFVQVKAVEWYRIQFISNSQCVFLQKWAKKIIHWCQDILPATRMGSTLPSLRAPQSHR